MSHSHRLPPEGADLRQLKTRPKTYAEPAGKAIQPPSAGSDKLIRALPG